MIAFDDSSPREVIDGLHEHYEARRDLRREEATAATGAAAVRLTQEYEACWHAMRALAEAAHWAGLADQHQQRRRELALTNRGDTR